MVRLFQQLAALGLALGWPLAPVATAGTVETFDHRTLEGTVSPSGETALIVQTPEGSETVALDQVQRAVFHAPRVLESRLPGGWQVEDIGPVHGHSMATNDVFHLRASGRAVKDPKQQPAHFAHRIVRADGEIVARLDAASLPGPSLAGILLRENLEPIGGLAFLAVGADHHLRFESREGGYAPLKRTDLGPVPLPLWLKLARQSKDSAVTAFRSADGVTWQKLAQSKLNCPAEPFPWGEDRWRPRWLAGLAVSGMTNDLPATARFDHAALAVRGLLGEYFEDADLRRLRFARPDSRVDFYWGLGSPGPGMDRDHFSIRWNGQVEPKFSENHRFYFEADDSARLWVNDTEIPKTAWRQRERNNKEMAGVDLPMVAGQKCSLKLEYRNTAGAASVRLGWSCKSQPLEVIPSSALSYTYTAASTDEEGDSTTTNALPARGVLLRGGSFLAGDVDSADDTSTTVTFAGRKELMILNTKIARVVFRPSRRAPPPGPSGHGAGLFLKNGDFLEGDFQCMTGRTLVVSSVVLGRRKFNLDQAGVVALVLNGLAPQPAAFEVKLLDGSRLCATRLRWTRDAVIVTDSTLGEIAIPQQELAEFRRVSAQ